MKRHFSAFVLLASVLLLTACSQDDLGEEGGKSHAKKNIVTFVIGGNSSSTRAAVDGQSTAVPRTLVAPAHVIDLPCEEDETPLCLVETVTDMDETYSDAVLGTRGIPVFTENFYNLYGQDLYVTAFEAKSGDVQQLADVWGSYLDNGGTVRYTKVEDEDYTYAYDYTKGQSVNLSWPKDNSMWFFLQAPYTETKKYGPRFYSDGSIRFDYTDPNIAQGAVITNGAVNQKDMLFSSKRMDPTGKDAMKANILMYHCLTGVKFQMGNIDGGITKITSVTLKGIYSSGSCVLKPNYGDGHTSKGGNLSNKNTGQSDGSKSAQCAIWSSHSTPVSYTETYDWSNGNDPTTDYLNHNDGNSKYLPDDFYYDTNGSTDVSKFNLNASDGSRTLYLVPQTTADNAVIEIAYQVGETPYKARVAFGGFTWKAGEIHTYTLTVTKADVSITASQQTADSSPVAIDEVRNTGSMPVYLRVAVSAAWYAGNTAENDYAVAPYTVVSGTDYTLNSDWFKSGDFLYYKHPVEASKQVSNKPFATFTPHGTSQLDGAHVEVKFFVQAVQFDKEDATDKKKSVKAAWGTEVADNLDTTIDNGPVE